jgi:hypothetical protein
MDLSNPPLTLEQSYQTIAWTTLPVDIKNVQWGIPYEIGARIKNNADTEVIGASLEFKLESPDITLDDFTELQFSIITTTVNFLTTIPTEVGTGYIIWRMTLPDIPGGSPDTYYEGNLDVTFAEGSGLYTFSARIIQA